MLFAFLFAELTRYFMLLCRAGRKRYIAPSHYLLVQCEELVYFGLFYAAFPLALLMAIALEEEQESTLTLFSIEFLQNCFGSIVWNICFILLLQFYHLLVSTGINCFRIWTHLKIIHTYEPKISEEQLYKLLSPYSGWVMIGKIYSVWIFSFFAALINMNYYEQLSSFLTRGLYHSVMYLFLLLFLSSMLWGFFFPHFLYRTQLIERFFHIPLLRMDRWRLRGVEIGCTTAGILAWGGIVQIWGVWNEHNMFALLTETIEGVLQEVIGHVTTYH